MCKTIVEYSCNHNITDESPCKAYLASINRAKKAQPIWSKIFCSISTENITCPSPPGGRAIIHRKCYPCLRREEWKRKDAEQEQHRSKQKSAAGEQEAAAERKRKRQEKAPPALLRAEEGSLQRRGRQEAEIRAQIQRTRLEHEALQIKAMNKKLRDQAKGMFRCSACESEHRYPEDWERRANGGLCCARGIDDFEEWEREKGMYPNGYVNSPRVVEDHSRPSPDRQVDNPRGAVSRSRNEIQQRSQQRVKSDREIRAEARDAAKSYGWLPSNGRDSAALEPGLVAAYINTSGGNTNSLPPPPRVAEPMYQELLLDHERWASARQTAHGRLPPEQEKPLPVIPLRVKNIPRRGLPQRIQTRELTPPPPDVGRSLTSKSSNQSHSSKSSMAGLSRSSRESSPPVSPLSTVPSPRLSRVMSDLGDEIDDEMRGWEDLMSPMESEHPDCENPMGKVRGWEGVVSPRNPAWRYPPWNDYRK